MEVGHPVAILDPKLETLMNQINEVENSPERQVEQFAKQMILACLKAEPELPSVQFHEMMMDMHMIDWAETPRIGGRCKVLTDLLIYPMYQVMYQVSGRSLLDGSESGWTSGFVEIVHPYPNGVRYQFDCRQTETGFSVTRVQTTPVN
jgi:hypothetical protein